MSTTHDLAQNKEQLEKTLWEMLDQLPQRDAIELSDARQWIGYMVNVMPNDAIWHMVRARGIGGSEIGGLVRNFLGERADFDFSARTWAQSKLLQTVPQAQNQDMRRGHDMEPLHAQRFYSEHNAYRDEVAFKALSNASSKHQWMRYSPDDLVLLNGPTYFETLDGTIELEGRMLIDYKSPSQVDANSRIAFQYACQLHQGAILCEEKGIELTGTMLSQFDWANWGLKNDFVQVNPDLCQLIIEAGDHYWDHVLRGQVPDFITKKRYELDEQVIEQYSPLAMRLGQINAMITALTKAAYDLRKKLSDGIGLDGDQARLDGQVVTFPGAIRISSSTSIDEKKVRDILGEQAIGQITQEKPDVAKYNDEQLRAIREVLGEQAFEAVSMKNTRTQYDDKAMAKRLKELGEDIKPYRKLSRLDPTLVFDAMLNAGHDPEDVIQETVRIMVDRDMREQAELWYQENFPELDLPEPPQLASDEIMENEPNQANQRNMTRSRPKG